MKNAVGFFLLLILFSSCSSVKSFEFKKVESWEMEGVGFAGSSLNARLSFYNPNSFAVTIKQLIGSMSVEGRELGPCRSDTTIRIRSKQTFTLPVRIEMKTSALLLGGLSLMAKDSILVRIKGRARVGRSGIFINYDFDNESNISTRF